MDEDMMETVDEALSAVFRKRAASVKKRAKGVCCIYPKNYCLPLFPVDSTTVMHFKMR